MSNSKPSNTPEAPGIDSAKGALDSLKKGLNSLSGGKGGKAAGYLEKAGELIGEADKGLDQTKKAILEKMKKEGNLKKVASNFYSAAEEGLRADMNEWGIYGEAQEAYLKVVREKWEQGNKEARAKEIMESPELSGLDDFINDLENLPKLKQAMESAEPIAVWEAKLKGYASQIPGLDQLVDEYFEPFMKSLGLGFFLSKKKKKPKEETGAEPEGAEADKKEGENTTEDEQENGTEQDESVAESNETMKKPGATFFLGDSLTLNLTSAAKDVLDINGKIDSKAKHGANSLWGLEKAKELAAKEKNPFKDMENAVILFGSNDLTNPNPQATIDHLQEIYKTLKDAGVKNIYAVTIPPFKGYSDFSDKPEANENRKFINQWIRKSQEAGFSDHVIDLCLTEEKGGLASNEDPEKLADSANAGDNLHVNKTALAAIYQRELEKGTNQSI
jgi:hypothetical protein